MSKELTKESVIQNKKESIKTLNKMLEFFINDPTGKHLKKANLISYWIKDYVKMIGFEEAFDPTKNIAYKRGNIVKLNFGFNIGSEYGGLHYGVVIDNNNHHSSPVITVIPLTSIKDTKEIHSNSVELGNELYKSLKLKYDAISKALKEEQEEIIDANAAFNVLIELVNDSLEKYKSHKTSDEKEQELSKAEKYLDATKKIEEIWKEKAEHNRIQQEYLEKIGLEISHMKEGSIALVNQVTTVSKMRIFDPRNLKGVLSGISLSEENMEKINQKLKELYIF
ncbi:type II toxin-antitoxin system PemK/MazF family toxin [Bariatricus sp. HCP3S3_E12]|uniref:type II toxin-antitoxin system PemK/MazF family toxin n=1 Tax=Bariatricus sp. HCP3S3_E12 TaxID=3438906 RepID=UPI003F89A372